MRSLPSLSALRTFEAAARHRSFKRAAAELHVTPTAVSHQIRSLEEAIGVQLFARNARRVDLTAAGELLFPTLRDSFDAIAHAVGVVAQPSRQDVVTVSATTAFTAKWLIPRLGRCPVALRLHATEDVVVLEPGAADFAIRYGRGPYPRLDVTPLVTDRFAPVVSPRLQVRTSRDLDHHRRIEFDWRKSDATTPTWARWARRASPGVKNRPAAMLRFSDESHAIQAAIAGHGVALLSLTLVLEELQTKLLEVPFGPVLEGPTYHLVHAEGRPLSPAATTLKQWLLGEARATREQLDRLTLHRTRAERSQLKKR